MSYKISWTVAAYADFSHIVLYIKETWGNVSAEEFVNQINTIMSILALFPYLGKLIHSQKQIRTLVITKQTKLIYRIKNNNVIILRLFDSRQDPDKFVVNENLIKYNTLQK